MAEVNFGEANPWVRTHVHPSNKNNRDKLGYIYLAEREGFEPSRQVAPTYSFSKAAPSATWVPLLFCHWLMLYFTGFSSIFKVFSVYIY